MGTLDRRALAEVRRWYEASAASLDAIAGRFGVSRGTIRYHAARNAWIRYLAVGRGRRRPPMAEAPDPAAAAEAAARAADIADAGGQAGGGEAAAETGIAAGGGAGGAPGGVRQRVRKRAAGAAAKRRPAATEDRPEADRARLVRRLYRAFGRQVADLEARFAGGETAGEEEARTLGTLARTLEKLIALERDSGGEESMEPVDLDQLRQGLAERIRRLPGGGGQG